MVGGDLVDVQVLMPPGASPHGYEPSPEAVRTLAKAEILFVVGRDLDGWAENLARGANPKIRIETLSQNMPLPEPEADPGEEAGEPHIWLDPVKAGTMARLISKDLVALRPQQADSLQSMALRATARLYALDQECRKAFAPVRDVPFAALHGGMNHLVTRYHLSQIAVIEIFPGREPSPKYLAQVVSSIRNTGARAVFSEPQLSPQMAEVVGKEAGVPVVEIDTIGGVPGKMTYEELIHAVVSTLVNTLGAKK
jgi:zinc transport system substrate-binding protein